MIGLENFYDAVIGKTAYDSTDSSIATIEESLMCWLNGLDFSNSREFISNIYNLFKEDFIYDGVLYRGISLDKNAEIKTNYLTSFTSDIEVAEEFANTYGKESQKSLIYKTSGRAFDFSAFLHVVNTKTSNVDLDIVIEERIWEEEKLYIFNVNEVELINV